MSNKDFDHLTIMRTRTGPCQGDSTERQMLDAINDTGSFRTRVMIHPDGSQTRMKTKGGMPEFITDEVHTTTEETELTVYMESGQLEYTLPGLENPERSYPAKWHFLDIDPSGDYLGYIHYDPASSVGAQKNDPALYEGMDSLAVGYPKKTTTSADDASRAQYESATAAKKLMMSMFPASLYSGKMRSFIQAQYGAKETTDDPLRVTISGASATLEYIRANQSITLGLWAHNSPGIYTAADGTFWLLSVSTTQFIAYPIKQDKAGKALLKVYNSTAVTDRSKLEPYIFAHSFIAINEGTTYAINGLPGGTPLAYGWKFNSTGSKASIVLHEDVGSYGDMKLRAWECHLTFSYSNGVFSVSEEVTNHGYWTDGWGTFNIFVPERDIATRLQCYSIAMQDGVAAAFDFGNVPVYGYYVDDVWKTVVISRELHTYSPGSYPWTLTYSGIVINSYADPSTNIAAWEEGFYEGMNPWEVHTEYKRSTLMMNISFDGFSFAGERKYVDTWDTYQTYSDPLPWTITIDWFAGQWGTGPACEYSTESALAFVNTPCGTYESCPDINGNVANWLTNRPALAKRHSETISATKYDERGWVLIVPGFDAEAVYIDTYTHQVFTAYSKTSSVSGNHFHAWQYVTGLAGAGAMYVTVYTSTVTWYADSWIESTETTTTPPAVPFVVEQRAFNSELHGDVCSDPLQPTSLFQVDRTYPYYDPGMFFFTSYGGRYLGSEGIKSPNSVRPQDRFVGWA